MGLAKDTHSDAAQFSYLATAFYVAYFVFELPSGYLIQRLPLAKYLGANGKIYPGFQFYMNHVNPLEQSSYGALFFLSILNLRIMVLWLR
jgi:hypothetical protein